MSKKNEELEWVTDKTQYSAADYGGETDLTGFALLKAKLAYNPFIPLGALSTLGFLVIGLKDFVTSNNKRSQLMMRGRVAAQGFTVFALISGVVMEGRQAKAEALERQKSSK